MRPEQKRLMDRLINDPSPKLLNFKTTRRQALEEQFHLEFDRPSMRPGQNRSEENVRVLAETWSARHHDR
jgi:hypothetical protein